MGFWPILFSVIASVIAPIAMRNAYRVYREPREVRTGVGTMNVVEARRAAVAVLIVAPLFWLVFVLFMLGVIADPKF